MTIADRRLTALTDAQLPMSPALRVQANRPEDPGEALESLHRDGVRLPATANVCVGIATRGRPEILAPLIRQLEQQTLQPAAILIACTTLADVGCLADVPGVTVLLEAPGLTRQRNGILRNLPPDTDVLVFFDDDFIPHPDWIASAVRAFDIHPTVGCITGHVIADGIKGPGLRVEDACAALKADDAAGQEQLEKGYSPYGCNMAIRRSALGSVCFDERLVLYGWLEDRDFGGALVQNGWNLLKIGAARGVHLGIKKGRVAGLKLGYSQVMNPVYLARKGTIPVSSMTEHVFRNVLANLVRFLVPEPYVDRRGRLSGNFIAFLDLLRGRLTPERAEHL